MTVRQATTALRVELERLLQREQDLARKADRSAKRAMKAYERARLCEERARLATIARGVHE